MTVAALIEKLKALPQDYVVYFQDADEGEIEITSILSDVWDIRCLRDDGNVSNIQFWMSEEEKDRRLAQVYPKYIVVGQPHVVILS